VMQRQQVEQPGRVVQPILPDEGLHLRREVAMRDLDTLGPRGRARG
jgi:hypothetical protein